MKRIIGAFWLLAAGLLPASPAMSQPAKPEIEINLDVLSDVAPPPQETAPVKNAVPAQEKTVMPSSTVETAPLPPAVPKAPLLTGPIIKPKISMPQMPEKTKVSAPKISVPARPSVKTAAPALPARKPTVADVSIAAPAAAKKPDVSALENLIESSAAPLPPQAVSDAQDAPLAVPAKSDLSFGFDGGSSDLGLDAQQKLDGIIRQMIEAPQMRLQLRSYASAADGTKSTARRLSLSRALAVREFLMSHGIESTRVDVRALGSETDTQPLDRVDAVFVK